MDFENLNIYEYLTGFKNDALKSKKLIFVYLILILLAFFSMMGAKNYDSPKIEILVLFVTVISGIFLITFYRSHNDDKNFYKTVFIVIFIFGILFSFLTPIMCTHDEVEHFVRAEITSQGVLIPEYNETPVTINGRDYPGHYQTIQSTYDLTDNGKVHNKYTTMDLVKSSILNTDADTQPINNTAVPFYSAFAQNPFYGYLASAIGIAIAKLLDLNAIWLLWLGRIFNSFVYAALASYAIKKTPILKMPLFVVACIPAALSQAASVSIDPVVNGLAILSIAYFLVLYKSPENSLDHSPLIKFSILIVLLGLCKVTYFSFILLLLFLPKENFKSKKYYYCRWLSLIIILCIAGLWSKFYVDPGVANSSRTLYLMGNNVDAVKQINYMLTHKKKAVIAILHLFGKLESDLKCQSYFTTGFSSLYLLFTGAVYLLYPHERFKPKTRIGALLVFMILYFGTYILFMLTWTPVGDLTNIRGVQARYFFPALALIPIFLGFNHSDMDTSKIDACLVMLTISFIVFRLLDLTIQVY